MSLWQIRPMQLEDLDAIMIIETLSFKTPWSRESFSNDFNRENSVILVGSECSILAGYLVAWLIVDEIHIGNLAVHPDYRRRGLAQALLNALLLDHPFRARIWLEVRRSNQAALELYGKMGFREAGIRKQYYAAEKEDAIVMVKE
jgi:ribosomal-protein-alanine N-acetyltransferase